VAPEPIKTPLIVSGMRVNYSIVGETVMPDNPDTALPADIAAAIEVFRCAARDETRYPDGANMSATASARAALTAAIFARLAAAEAKLAHCEKTMAPLSNDGQAVWVDGTGLVPLDYSQGRDLAAALARAERLEAERDAAIERIISLEKRIDAMMRL
jgi:hypothetical protein